MANCCFPYAILRCVDRRVLGSFPRLEQPDSIRPQRSSDGLKLPLWSLAASEDVELTQGVGDAWCRLSCGTILHNGWCSSLFFGVISDLDKVGLVVLYRPVILAAFAAAATYAPQFTRLSLLVAGFAPDVWDITFGYQRWAQAAGSDHERWFMMLAKVKLGLCASRVEHWRSRSRCHTSAEFLSLRENNTPQLRSIPRIKVERSVRVWKQLPPCWRSGSGGFSSTPLAAWLIDLQ